MAEIKEGFESDFSKLGETDKKVIATNAAIQGITPQEYLEFRGGLDPRGRYGDMFDPNKNLTVTEYDAALQAAKDAGLTGADVGRYLSTEEGKKLVEFYLTQGISPDQIKLAYGYDLSGNYVGINSDYASSRAALFIKQFQSGLIDKEEFDRLMSIVNGSSPVVGSGSSTAVTTQTSFGPGTPGYEERKSAYDLLYSQFAQYGLQSLVEPLKGLILEGISPSEFTIRLRETDAYKKRFAANQARISKGLRALSEAEYIGLEDAYQGIMRSYGLPASFYTKGDLGVQQGFEKFLAADVSPAELEDRIQTAQNRVINAAPEVADTLRQFYPGISNGDILAYTLDPESALPEIKRKITAAEIGAGAVQSGLVTGMARAEELGRYGVTGQQAREGYQAIADFLPRGGQLAEIYKQSPYTQTTAEQEVFGVPGSVEAAKQRKKLTSLEQASFAGSSGAAQGALARDRAGSF